MNPSVEKLYSIAQKPSRTVIGLMSGTSLDGLDIALCQINGSGNETGVELKNFKTIPYDSELKKRLKAISSVQQVSLKEVCLLHSKLAGLHAEFILSALEKWDIKPDQIDCIASHGQTIYHAPKIQHRQDDSPNTTLQIGDGDHIARKTGILTISDFRQKHTAAGGEGAPLAAPVDQMLFTHESENRILLNIGGIANFTYLPASSNPDKAPITTDTGPGNTLIDNAVQKYFDKDFDKNGRIARQGSVNKTALKALKTDPYFKKSFPKTTGPEVFNLEWMQQRLDKSKVGDIPSEDIVATLTRLSADTITESVKKVVSDSQNIIIYVSGGGFHNPVLMDWLNELLPDCHILSFAKIGFDPDAKEAVIFAILANELLAGEGFSINTDSNKKVNFGKISFPE
ncbi:anhydro-N-acetylmuramic acid kinase [Aliifodinibius salipaludis]|uniref:Anhydro-N-acetylmuramic acid kinase n=1 Tax=Fodinibius salipaludis TaxID=2032627 RepID=A0A2A2GAD8_9BACT|nr:anhydro-N-acetylmuramic acid kinase [Aliifodinibius salipaludis]PAU94130.1 anhydro-N-acetylmuramic acid kinase [Aliifodinibius salipaludis]